MDATSVDVRVARLVVEKVALKVALLVARWADLMVWMSVGALVASRDDGRVGLKVDVTVDQMVVLKASLTVDLKVAS